MNAQLFMAVLRQVPVFASIDDDSLRKLAARSRVNHFQKGQYLFMEGDQLDRYHVIIKGEVEALKQSPTGRHLTVVRLYSGDTFGDMALFDGEPLSVTLLALRDTFVAAMERDAVLAAAVNNPDMFRAITKTIARRFKSLQDRMIDMVAAGIDQRVIGILAMLYRQFGMVLPLTHEEIADMAGTSRETVTRVLNRLHQSGLIRSERQGAIVLTEAALTLWGKEVTAGT